MSSISANLNYYRGLTPSQALDIIKTASDETIQIIGAYFTIQQVEYVRDMLVAPQKVNLLLSVWNRAYPESQL
jgi:hypothetical protein